ncbi:SURF1-domain-containing protein [Trametes sanguinea]|nr:SURF1-domain-containing protein [Trametes sanguinea]
MVSTEGTSQTYRAKREPLITPFMVLVGIIPIFTFALGTWQVQRLKWKIALIDDLEEKLEREPLPLPPRVNLEALPDFQFRKVVLKGRWDNAHAILLGPRVRDGTIGYHLVVPFVRSDGSTVLVDRGFVTRDLAQTARRIQDQQQGEVEILGMLRTAQVRNAYTPDNHPEKGEWYWADVDAMAAHAGGEEAGVQPVFVEEVFEGHAGEANTRLSHGVPVGRTPTVDIRNSHVSYIVTWYSLSAFTTAMFIRLLLKRRQALGRLPRY